MCQISVSKQLVTDWASADIWVEGNPLQPQALVPLLRRLASEQPPDLRELGLDAEQACCIAVTDLYVALLLVYFRHVRASLCCRRGSSHILLLPWQASCQIGATHCRLAKHALKSMWTQGKLMQAVIPPWIQVAVTPHVTARFGQLCVSRSEATCAV